jgi:hypothetical protein
MEGFTPTYQLLYELQNKKGTDGLSRELPTRSRRLAQRGEEQG